MRFVFSILLALSFAATQVSAHECLGACASENGPENVQSKADHSCCEDMASLSEDEESHDCGESQCLEIASLTPESFSLTSESQIESQFSKAVPVASQSLCQVFKTKPEFSIQSDPPRRLPHLGLYIILKRLRVS